MQGDRQNQKPKNKFMSKEYIVLVGNSPDEIMAEVGRFLADSWELQGGVAVTSQMASVDMQNEVFIHFYQAMVREVEQKKSRGGKGGGF